MKRSQTAGLALALVAFTVPAGTVAAQDYYEGRTISLIVPVDPGGSTDTNWRMVAPFLSKHIPGNPEVIIQNMSGGSGNTGANYVYERARPDGLTLLAGPWNAIGALTGAPGMRFDYNEMEFIGGFPDTVMNYARRDVVEGGLQDPTQIVEAEEFVLAGLRPDSSLDLTSRLSLDLLGANYRYVTGFADSSKRTASVMSGETDASSVGYVGFKSSVEPAGEGELVGLYYHALEPRPSIEDLMDFPSFYEKIHGEAPSGEEWEMLRFVYLATGVFLQSLWAPPGTDEEAIAALEAGYASMMADPELAQITTDRLGAPIEFVPTETGRQTVRELFENTPPELVESLQAYVASGS